MSKRRQTKLVREGAYVAEVEVELIEAEGAGPLTSLRPTPAASTMCEKPCDEAMSLRQRGSGASSASRLSA